MRGAAHLVCNDAGRPACGPAAALAIRRGYYRRHAAADGSARRRLALPLRRELPRLVAPRPVAAATGRASQREPSIVRLGDRRDGAAACGLRLDRRGTPGSSAGGGPAGAPGGTLSPPRRG